MEVEISNAKQKLASTSAGITVNLPSPKIPDGIFWSIVFNIINFKGEDSESFKRHNKAIVAEYRRTSPDRELIKELADLSFAMRREDVLNTLSLKEVLAKYPFLQYEKQVH